MRVAKGGCNFFENSGPKFPPPLLPVINDHSLIGIVARYWLGSTRVVMRGTKGGIIGKKSPKKPQENVVVFVLVTCGHDVGTVASAEPALSPLLVTCGFGRHVSCARVWSIGTYRYSAGLMQANTGYTLAGPRLPGALPADKKLLSRHIL